jgi:hypothetical protein
MTTESGRLQEEIDHRRHELAQSLDLLQDKIHTATDWRARFQDHPWTMMGAAVGVGVLLSTFFGGRNRCHQVGWKS